MNGLTRISRREAATAKQSVDSASCQLVDSNSAPDRDHRPKEAMNSYLDGQLFNEGQGKKSATTRYFPPEIWFSIVFHSANLVARCQSEESSIYKSSPKVNLLWNLGSVSKLHRKIALRYWVHSVKLREQFDLEKLLNMGTFNGMNLTTHVRRLVCKNEYNIYWAPQHTFMELNFLEELELHCHQDIRFEEGEISQSPNPDTHLDPPPADLDEPGGHAAHPSPEVVQPTQMFYRRLKVHLPATLRTLKVYESHAPDIYFIRQVIEQCPLLQSLTLSRCTLFTRQECKFWKNLPQGESDSYFSDQEVPAYASAVAGELKGIKNLRELEIGIYLTAHAAIGTHLQQHTRLDGFSRASLKAWEEPCEECNIQYREPTLAAEGEATEILAREIPTLSLVSWASFCSEKRIGWSTHRISRDQEGNFEKLASITK